MSVYQKDVDFLIYKMYYDFRLWNGDDGGWQGREGQG